MAKLPLLEPFQLEFPFRAEIVPPGESYEGIDPNRKVNFSKLLQTIGVELQLEEPTPEDLEAVEPKNIEIGLVLPFNSPLLRKSGTPAIGHHKHFPRHGNLPNKALLFPADEFPIIVGSPKQLAMRARAYSNKKQENMTDEEGQPLDRNTRKQTSVRAGRHALAQKIGSMTGLIKSLEDKVEINHSLQRALASPSRAYQRADRLDLRRSFIDTELHRALELSGTILGIKASDEKKLNARHGALKFELYSDLTYPEIADSWGKYLNFDETYKLLRIEKITASILASDIESSRLTREEQKLIDEAAAREAAREL